MKKKLEPGVGCLEAYPMPDEPDCQLQENETDYHRMAAQALIH